MYVTCILLYELFFPDLAVGDLARLIVVNLIKQIIADMISWKQKNAHEPLGPKGASAFFFFKIPCLQ